MLRLLCISITHFVTLKYFVGNLSIIKKLTLVKALAYTAVWALVQKNTKYLKNIQIMFLKSIQYNLLPVNDE